MGGSLKVADFGDGREQWLTKYVPGETDIFICR